jgi:luciferase family oxidoreductase group 1
MEQRFRVGVLDFCRVFDGKDYAGTIWNTLELAPRVEEFGYERYWLSEHHTADTAHSSPEILLGILAGLTTRIRVGTAGILLRFHNPLRVAKDFRVLTAVYPDRIDLGLARGGIPEPIRSLLGAGSQVDIAYEDKVRDLLSYLHGTGAIAATPIGVPPPEVWVLGSQSTSMTIAAKNGTCFCLALFLDRAGQPDLRNVIDEYRRDFIPSTGLVQPQWSIAVAGVCADTTEKAHQLVELSQPLGVTPTVVGDQMLCRRMFEDLQRLYMTNSFIFLDVCRGAENRLRSYKLLAESLGLAPQWSAMQASGPGGE